MEVLLDIETDLGEKSHYPGMSALYNLGK